MHKSIAYTCLLGATLALAACDKPRDEERRPVTPTTQETPSQTAPADPQRMSGETLTTPPAPQPDEPTSPPVPSYDEN